MANAMIPYSEDPVEAAAAAALRAGETAAFSDQNVIVEGQKVIKDDFFMTLTNQRIQIYTMNHWKAFFMTYGFGMLGRTLMKKKPAYEIPLEAIESTSTKGKSVTVTTKAGESVTYVSCNKKLMNALAGLAAN